MPRTDVILFLDLEMTGNTDDDEVVEVGLVLTTREFDVIDDWERIIAPSDWGMQRIRSNSVVNDMHTKSGLLAELVAIPPRYSSGPPVLFGVDEEICTWLDKASGTKTEHIPFAGSGVCHFDRKFIHRDFPLFDKRLTYWPYDVGVLRRSWQLAGLPTATRPADLVGHRALHDAYAAVSEYREYVRQLRKLKV